MKDQIIWVYDFIKNTYKDKISNPISEYLKTRINETEFLIDDKENDADRFFREFNIELDEKGVPKTRNGLRCYRRNIWDSREGTSIIDIDEPWEDDVKCNPNHIWNTEEDNISESEQRLNERLQELERMIENV